MKIERLNSDCIFCLAKKYLPMHPEDAAEEKKIEYMQKMLKILAEAQVDASAPEIVDEIRNIQKEVFDFVDDYSEAKVYFNNLMMGFEKQIRKEIEEAEDSLKMAVCFSMTGNYIDFGTMESVDEAKLYELLEDAKNLSVDKVEFEKFKTEIKGAKRLVFLTDNCGEIVLDKLLTETIKRENPHLEISVIVRGAPVLNDATMEDAVQVGFLQVAEVSDNGSAVAGTCIERISEQAREKIDSADVIVAKGQGNFETMRFCGKNVYYLFMCKCMMFAKRFDVPQYSPMLLNDLRMGDGM